MSRQDTIYWCGDSCGTTLLLSEVDNSGWIFIDNGRIYHGASAVVELHGVFSSFEHAFNAIQALNL